jgi:predicted metalloprotease
MVLFTDQIQTGCGNAPAAVGPFYCPADKTVYLDPTFFDELQQTLGGSKAEFSQAYVIAHEVGHHVQNLLGYSRIVDEKRRTLPKAEFNQWSVRLELQADYLAGVWGHYGQEEFHFIEPGDVESAIQSANAIGDDRLQKRARGFTSPESYTHGTSAQRVKWFSQGLKTGDMRMLRRIFEVPYNEL